MSRRIMIDVPGGRQSRTPQLFNSALVPTSTMGPAIIRSERKGIHEIARSNLEWGGSEPLSPSLGAYYEGQSRKHTSTPHGEGVISVANGGISRQILLYLNVRPIIDCCLA